MRKNDVYLCLDAPAKINLYLHITGRRPDGYHLLDSLVGFTEYADRVSASPADELSLRIQGAHGLGLQGNEEDNLIMRSARALRDSFGVREGAALTLEKNLPVSSGIGGGSADAAAALRLLARLWKVDVNDRDLSDIGLKIGSDIPVCIVGTPSKMSGAGETVHPAKPLPDCAVLLVNGGEAVSTSAVFGASRHHSSVSANWVPPDDFEGLVSNLLPLRNDLTGAAQQASPVIREILSVLEKSEGCALARVSGSGGTCFGLFADLSQGDFAQKKIERLRNGWWSVVTEFRALRSEIKQS